MKTKRVLVLSQNEAYSTNVVRCLSSDDPYVYYLAGMYCFHKKLRKNSVFRGFIETSENYSDLFDVKSKILNEIISIINQLDINVVSPSDFESLKFLCTYKCVINRYANVVPLPDITLVNLLDIKSTCIEYVKRESIQIPQSILSPLWDDLSCDTLGKLNYPVLVKSDTGAGGEGIVKFDNAIDLNAYISDSLCRGAGAKEGKYIQEYIDGVDYCFNAYSINGVIKAWTIFRYVKLDNSNSMGKFAEFVDDKEVFENGKKILSVSNYTGPIVIDFRRENDNGKLYFLEVNPRFGGNSIYSIVDGINFFTIGVELATNTNSTFKPWCSGVWSCGMKRLFTAPFRKIDLYPFQFILNIGLPQVLFIYKQNKEFFWSELKKKISVILVRNIIHRSL